MNIKKYRSKPVVKEALLYTGENWLAVMDFCQEKVTKIVQVEEAGWVNTIRMTLKTLEGPVELSPGNYVVKGICGEFYPCRHDIFEETYEEIEE